MNKVARDRPAVGARTDQAVASVSPEANCGDCRFWLGGTEGDPTHGLCRRFPPVPCGVGYASRTGWPETTADEWCGEHRP